MAQQSPTADASLARRQGTAWLGYGAPLAAAAVSAWAFFGPGRFDETALRLSLEIFGTAAGIGAVWPGRSVHVGLVALASTGLTVTGLGALGTMGSVAWLGAALCGVALVDAAHAADHVGQSLGRAPLVGGAVALAISAVVQAAL